MQNLIEIIDYNKRYAKSVAEMWNASSEGWNGEVMNKTEDQVREMEDKNTWLFLLLAVENDTVLGYCSVSEDYHDKNALYVELLNVRTYCHGKKIGKKLILEAVRRTIKHGYSRLDLNTWAGNTKAVPLYKKTGFMWEDRDESVHLMNYIPTILQTDLFQDYFKKVDWYADSTRKIEVVPDGRIEKKFNFFTYSWSKDDENLILEYCRRGRGLRKIETNDYVITASIENLDLISGVSYPMTIEIENKTGKELHIEMLGLQDNNVKTELKFNEKVTGKKVIQGTFFIEGSDDEQTKQKEHPGPKFKLLVNGKEATMKLGILGTKPLTMNLSGSIFSVQKCKMYDLYLNMKNNMKVDAEFSFTLPNSENYSFEKNEYNVAIPAQSRQSIPLKIKVLDAISETKQIEFQAKTELENITFTLPLELFYPISEQYIIGDFKKKLTLAYNNKAISIDKKADPNAILFYDYTNEGDAPYFPEFAIGKPYSTEFSKRKYEKYWIDDSDITPTLKIQYTSEKSEFKNMLLLNCIKLHPDGTFERWFEVENKAQTEMDLFIQQGCAINTNSCILPYDNDILSVSIESPNFWSWEKFNTPKMTENWIFQKRANSSFAMYWTKETSFSFDEWKVNFEHKLAFTSEQKKLRTGSVFYAQNKFRSVKSLRDYLASSFTMRKEVKKHLNLNVNNGNPFISDQFQAGVQERFNIQHNGKMSIEFENETYAKALTDEDLEVIQLPKLKSSNAVLTMKIKSDDSELVRQKMVFAKSQNPIISEIQTMNDKKVHVVKNEFITIKASNDYAPVLFSMQYEGQEWLDHSFPEKTVKCWWNSWAGGMISRTSGLRLISIFKEDFKVEFTEQKDQFDNVWTGLKVSYSVDKFEDAKGIVVHDYYLLQPGVKTMLHVTKVEQKSGKYIRNFWISNDVFVKASKEINGTGLKFNNPDNLHSSFYAGNLSFEQISEDECLHFISKEREDEMLIYYDKSKLSVDTELNTDLAIAFLGERFEGIPNKTIVSSPKFYLFGKPDELNEYWFEDLKNIKLK